MTLIIHYTIIMYCISTAVEQSRDKLNNMNNKKNIDHSEQRLCPADQELTEECFRKMPLEFVG